MIKYLLLGLLIAWLFFASPWGRPRPRNAPSRKPAAPPSPLQMVACAHCGMHLPANEALVSSQAGEQHHFCSEDHRRAGPRAH
ncbi:PP0621 family protein [Aquabacterium sp.]|uniref:PP0621 family protein n=1 Tax=Aquabacterium sp. TaxID=1872578 RepID=UPI003D6D6A40